MDYHKTQSVRDMDLHSDEITILEAVQNNGFLSESTSIQAQTLLAKAQDDLIHIDDEITRVQALLDDLHLRRRTKAAQIDIYGSASAPLRKLANEILSYIFDLCCFDTPVTPIHVATQQQHIIGRVCLKWRQLSFRTPELWSQIEINHRSHDHSALPAPLASDASYSIFLQNTRQFIERSGRVPLSLTVYNDPSDSNPLDPFMTELGRVIQLGVHRSSTTLEQLLALPYGTLPSLRSLDIKGHHLSDMGRTHNLLSSPNLREFSCAGSLSTSVAWINELPLSQLTRLHIPSTILCTEHFISILALTPNLADCSFAAGIQAHDYYEFPAPSLPLVLPHLHTFHITLLRTSLFNDVLEPSHINFPNLRSFVIETGSQQSWDSRWTPLILRSGILERLRIEDHNVPVHEIERILKSTPLLTELILGSGHMFTSSLLRKMANGELVPRLQKLRCFIAFTNLDDYGALDLHLTMLEHRRKETTPASHIAHAHFVLLASGDGGMEASETIFPGLERIKRLTEEGWNIQTSVSE